MWLEPLMSKPMAPCGVSSNPVPSALPRETLPLPPPTRPQSFAACSRCAHNPDCVQGESSTPQVGSGSQTEAPYRVCLKCL